MVAAALLGGLSAQAAARMEHFGALPMHFEANRGQADAAVKFLARGQGYTLWLKSTEAVLALNPKHREPADSVELRLSLAGANPAARAEGGEKLPGIVNYFFGDRPEGWLTDIATHASVRYREVYPGVDLIYYGNQQQLEYDFAVQPGASPECIALEFQGADGLELDPEGHLLVHLAGGVIRWKKPFTYQDIAGERREIPSRYDLQSGCRIGFEVGAYDQSQVLVIDPVLVLEYSTYLGGSDLDVAKGIARDAAGNVYVVGETSSTNFPTMSAYRSTPYGLRDLFVTKLNSNGTALVYSTYLGGSGDDYARGIAVDSGGNAYVVGQTASANFPRQNAFQTSVAGAYEGFLSKLGPNGNTLAYSTYFGGTSDDGVNGVAVDNSGNAFLVGETFSDSSFPTKIPFQSKAGGAPPPGNNASLDAFVARFNTTLSGANSLIFSSWLGGRMDEKGTAIALDASTNLFVTGIIYWDYANSVDFPTLNAWQNSYGGGGSDGFLAKVSFAGAKLFATYLGAEEDDSGFGIATDPAGNVYVTGETVSTSFPVTANAVQPALGGGEFAFGYDAFVTKFNGTGSTLLYSTYLGGFLSESGAAIAVDRDGYIYVTGRTLSFDFPVTDGTFQELDGGSPGPFDAFVTKVSTLAPGPAGLVFSTFLGGNMNEQPFGIVLETNANFYVAGLTSSTNFPTSAGAYRTSYQGGVSDAFITKFSSAADLSVSVVASPGYILAGSNVTYTITLANNGRVLPNGFSAVWLTNTLPEGLQLLAATTTFGSLNTNVPGLVIGNFGQLTNNAVVVVTLVARTTVPATVVNTAVVSSVETPAFELNTGNNTAVTESIIRGIADVTLAMTATPSPAYVASNLVYTIGVTNKGPATAYSISVTSALPANVSIVSMSVTSSAPCSVDWLTNVPLTTCDCASLTNGEGAAITLTVRPTAAGTIVHSAGVSALEPDSTPANNTNRLITSVVMAADLMLTQSAAPNPVFVNSNLVYTLTVTNFGPANATSVVLTDPLPPNVTYLSAIPSQGSVTQFAGTVTCNLGTITNGRGATGTLTVRPTSTGVLTNTASVTNAGALDFNLANNSAASVVQVISGGSPGDPFLKIARVGTNVVLSWSLNTVGYSLYSKVNLPTGTWTTVTNVPVVIGSEYHVTNAITSPGRYYRLMKIIGPNLTATRSGNNLLILWTTNAAGYTLQANTNLATPGLWVAMTNQVTVMGSQFAVSDPILMPRKYYRLARPLN